jgi:hypothetical protein
MRGKITIYIFTSPQLHLKSYLEDNTQSPSNSQLYSVSINSFPDYRHLLKEKYVQYKQEHMLKCTNVSLNKTSWVELHFKKYFFFDVVFL